MKCKWCGAGDVSSGHACADMPLDAKQERENCMSGIAAAVGASGRYYVMMEPTRDLVGPFVRLILAKASDTLVDDTIIDRCEIKISDGGWAYLNSKYGNLGRLESFDDFATARTKHSIYLKEVMANARRE